MINLKNKKEKAMTVYHVETQGDYDALMIELEEKGCEWRGGEKPTKLDNFKDYGKDTYIFEEHGSIISFSNGYYFKVYRSNETLIEYKAKGENMTQEEMKQNILGLATYVSIAAESLVRDIKFERKESTVEFDLQEAKSSAKKLIENIDEYLEYQKPKFKVGDYVTFDIPNKKIAKIERLNGALYGLWYDTESENIKDDLYFGSGNKFRHATPTEILEYEVALTFLKHDRKPFEVKRGDVVYLKGYDKNIFLDSGNFYEKHNFIDGDIGLVKTVEEFNEWLENK